jgi:DNA repair protein RecO (recombination protein O)
LEWSDVGIALSVRSHGESSAILETLTREHGRHLGLIRGGASRRLKSLLQPGNSLQLHWRARLSEHLGNFSAEIVQARAGTLLDRLDALVGLNAFTSVASAVLPERESHRSVFEGGEILLEAIMQGDLLHWAPLYVRWEAGLLDELGFGLDLTQCAVTGARDGLAFVSPRSGRAVSAEGAGTYRDRLLPLPLYLTGAREPLIDSAEIVAGLRLTGHFLAQRVLEPHGRQMPAGRMRLDELATRESK